MLICFMITCHHSGYYVYIQGSRYVYRLVVKHGANLVFNPSLCVCSLLKNSALLLIYEDWNTSSYEMSNYDSANFVFGRCSLSALLLRLHPTLPIIHTTHTHALTHALTHTHTCTHACTHTHNTHMHAHTYTHTSTHTCMHTHASTKYTVTHALHTQHNTRMRVCACAHTHTYTHTHIHTHTHMHTHIHIRMQAHAHIHALVGKRSVLTSWTKAISSMLTPHVAWRSSHL